MSRIEKKFKELKDKSEKALIPFITMGDPNVDETVEIVLEMEKAGADIIEIGIPYNDPLADGPVIQDSYYRALQNGCTLEKSFESIKRIREKSNIPLVMMIYFNIIFTYGVEKFFKSIKDIGIDGIIVPDLPLEEQAEIKSYAKEFKIDLIPLVAPTSKNRIPKIIKDSTGFIYCVSVNGTTGERKNFDYSLDEYLEKVKLNADIPYCLGFGISSKENIIELRDKCNGLIVGSAIVKRIGKGKKEIFKFVRELKDATINR